MHSWTNDAMQSLWSLCMCVPRLHASRLAPTDSSSVDSAQQRTRRVDGMIA